MCTLWPFQTWLAIGKALCILQPCKFVWLQCYNTPIAFTGWHMLRWGDQTSLGPAGEEDALLQYRRGARPAIGENSSKSVQSTTLYAGLILYDLSGSPEGSVLEAGWTYKSTRVDAVLCRSTRESFVEHWRKGPERDLGDV